MALSDVKIRSAKSEARAYKLTDGEGMVLLVHPTGNLTLLQIQGGDTHL